MSRPRAAIVATGSELVRGERQDRNGPFLAAEVVRLGLEPASIRIVGDGVDDLEQAFSEALSADLCLVSGGLGPTHDDRTVELVARVAGRPLILDEELEEQIGSVSRALAERLGRSYDDFAPGVRKQATRPEGSVSLGLAGTTPGLVLDLGDCVVVVLPGPRASSSDSGPARSRPTRCAECWQAHPAASITCCGSSARRSRRSRRRSPRRVVRATGWR